MSERTPSDAKHHPGAAPCGRRFAPELLSGYLDGALTQGDEQRVRLHLEDCPLCRAELAELTSLREVTMSTEFPVPPDDQWDESPRGAVSRWSRRTGWLFVIVWALGVAAFVLYELATGPEGLLEKVLVFGGIFGFALLFLSILLDRLRALPGDRYREVKK